MTVAEFELPTESVAEEAREALRPLSKLVREKDDERRREAARELTRLAEGMGTGY